MRKIPFLLSASVSVLALTSSVSLSLAADVRDDEPEIVLKTRTLVEQLLVEAELPERECTEACTADGCSDDCPKGQDPKVLLATLLVEAPSAVEAIGPVAVDAIRAKSTSDAQGDALLECLLSTRNTALEPVATAMYEAAPAKFASERLLGFCELGCKDLRKPLVKRVAKGEAGLLEAAYVASIGDDAGAKILKRAFKAAMKVDELDAATALDALVAGRALERLGKKGALKKAQLAVHAATLEALDGDETDRARGLAIAAMIAHGASHQTKPAFSTMHRSLSKTLEGAYGAGELDADDSIFALIEELTPIG